MKRLILLGMLLGLASCASSGGPVAAPAAGSLRPSDAAPAHGRDDELGDLRSAGPEVYTDLIRRMIEQQQYYAALAHIQEQQVHSGNSDELRYLEAEARRQLAQPAEAEKLYRGLLRGHYSARAYRGLGLLSVPRDLPGAIGLFREAVRRAPTDVDTRNDLGYALMLSGHYREALPEIATAVELDPNATKARNNLIVLLMLSRDEAGVKRVADAGDVSAPTIAQLRRQAQSLGGPSLTRRGVP